MIQRFKGLRKLDRKRLDAALMRIQGRPTLMTLFNMVLVGINSLSNLKRIVKLALNKLKIINIDPGSSNDSFNFLPDHFETKFLSEKLSVLIVCEVTIPQCFRYRVEQKIEQLELLGLRSNWLNWTDYFDVKNQIHFHDIIIFYRVPGYPKAIANIEYATRIGKIVVYDTDDLIYDRQILESYYGNSTGQLSSKELKAVLNGADIYQQAIKRCQFALTTSLKLKESLGQIVGLEKVFILPNALDNHIDKIISNSETVKQTGKVTLFYGSGSKTHDEDFALIADVLARLFDQYEFLQLVVIGFLTLPEKLVIYSHRITQIQFLEIDEYLHVLSHADINLAPLKSGLFADCKSEIKWLEAGALNIPTIASATDVYQNAITHGENGLIAKDSQQWYELLQQLITSQDFREKIGQAASITAQTLYSPKQTSQTFSKILKQLRSQYLGEQSSELKPKQTKHIVVVNVLYPPLAMGGATVVAENLVNTINHQYKNEFRVSVFTCDINNIYAYQLKEYEHKGARVTAVSVPVGPEVDLRGYDGHVEAIFTQFLEHQQPDLIHFHSIQRLTSSMLQASLDLNIPFVVTVHDAWWLSDHQFLVDSQGKPTDSLQSNALIAAKTSTDMQQTVHRSVKLRELINKAQRVLAVSEYQAAFYQQNGVNNVVVNSNGVDRLDLSKSLRVTSAKVVIGYTGSVCHHKGYYFLKEVVGNLDLKNVEFKVIQFDLTQPKTESWNQAEVEYLPKFNSTNMAEFYQQIDVLIAPSMWPESFGLITREAALSGIWVIASQAGGLAELVRHGENGFKFELGDSQQLANILNEIDNDPQRFKQRLPEDIVSKLNVNTVEEQVFELIGIYKNCLDKPSGIQSQ